MRSFVCVVAILAAAVMATACSTLTNITGPGEEECSVALSPARCEAMLASVAGRQDLDPAHVVRIDVLAKEPVTMDRAHAVRLRITLDDGRTLATEVACPGIAAATQAECMDVPRVVVDYPGSGSSGYHDFPEGATPFPRPDPAAVAAAQPLLIAHQTVTIERTGATRVVLGQARLANGIIQHASFELGDEWPDNVVLFGGVTMEIAPAGGPPIWNIYEHGWRDGVELVEVSITFDAEILREGAALELVNVVVR